MNMTAFASSTNGVRTRNPLALNSASATIIGASDRSNSNPFAPAKAATTIGNMNS